MKWFFPYVTMREKIQLGDPKPRQGSRNDIVFSSEPEARRDPVRSTTLSLFPHVYPRNLSSPFPHTVLFVYASMFFVLWKIARLGLVRCWVCESTKKATREKAVG